MRPRSSQPGAVSVEFALVGILFATVLFAVVEFGRWLAALDAATHATRTGARLAAVCDIGTRQVKERMRALVPGIDLQETQISVLYQPAGCTAANCLTVRVELSGAAVRPAIPFFTASYPIPASPSVVTRESLLTEIDKRDNPRCYCGAAGGNACT